MIALIYQRADGTQKSCELGEKPLIIGRLPESEIQVRDEFISRVHASVTYVNCTFVLKDLGSVNGTYRNGARVYECDLAAGDKIHIGNVTFVFEIDATTGTAILRKLPTLTTVPRSAVALPATAASAAPPDGYRPNATKAPAPSTVPLPAVVPATTASTPPPGFRPNAIKPSAPSTAPRPAVAPATTAAPPDESWLNAPKVPVLPTTPRPAVVPATAASTPPLGFRPNAIKPPAPSTTPRPAVGPATVASAPPPSGLKPNVIKLRPSPLQAAIQAATDAAAADASASAAKRS